MCRKCPSVWCSSILYPATTLNVKVEKEVYSSENHEFQWKRIPIAFGDYSPDSESQSSNSDGKFNADERETDYLIFLENTEDNKYSQTWSFTLDSPSTTSDLIDCCNEPQLGDTANIVLRKPFYLLIFSNFQLNHHL